jgi:hypothetical protein
MKEWDWEDFTDEDIKDEMTLVYLGMERATTNKSYTEKQKQRLYDEYLDKLNSLYNEQRKRGTFKKDSDRTS